jgi:predicted transposase YdaD
MYVHFSKPESYRIFDNEIKTITNNNITMGIEELVLHLTEQKGIEKGIEEGLEKGNVKEVRNLITKLGLSDEQAADVAGVTIEFVKQVRATLKEQ